MGNFLGTLLYFLVLLVAVFGIMYFGNKYVFSKVRINKYIIRNCNSFIYFTNIYASYFR